MTKNKQKDIQLIKIEKDVLESAQRVEIKENTFEEAYSEQQDFSFRYAINSDLDSFQIKNNVKKHYLELVSYKKKLIQKHLIFKIFVYASPNNEELKKNLDKIDHHIILISSEYENFKKELEVYEINDKNTNAAYMYDKLNQIFMFNQDLENNLGSIQKKYFKKIKTVSFSSCLHKSNKELIEIEEKIKDFINEYKDMDTAISYISYHSASLVTDTINSLLKILSKKSREVYTFKYFIPAEAFVFLTMSEWIGLFNKFKYMVNLYNIDRKENKGFFKEYDRFELYYMLLLINFERGYDV